MPCCRWPNWWPGRRTSRSTSTPWCSRSQRWKSRRRPPRAACCGRCGNRAKVSTPSPTASPGNSGAISKRSRWRPPSAGNSTGSAWSRCNGNGRSRRRIARISMSSSSAILPAKWRAARSSQRPPSPDTFSSTRSSMRVESTRRRNPNR